MTTKAIESTLAYKIAEAIADLPDNVEPEGVNPHFRYKFYSEKQVSALFRKRLASRGIIMIPHVASHETVERETRNGRSYLTSMLVEFTLTDGTESYTGSALGQGDDASDKGANKAFTAATKYFLLKLGLVGGDSDAEADAETDRRASGSPVEVGPSDIKGIQRGGRSTNATEAQIKRVRVLARDLDVDPYGVAIIIGGTLDKEPPVLPGREEGDAGPILVDYLGTLTADELGKVVAAMSEMKETAASAAEA
jgi:hypothetical protein